MTNELKQQYFALYWGQKIGFVDTGLPIPLFGHLSIDGKANPTYILLRPLSSITDEELEEWHQLRFGKTESQFIHKALFDGMIHQAQPTDWARKKGFALPYLGIPVEQWIEWGVVKLKKYGNQDN